MALTLHVTRITDKQCTRLDYAVMSGGLPVGRIYEDTAKGNNPKTRWSWMIHDIYDGPGIPQMKGQETSLESAKEQLRANWLKWLAWAQLAELPQNEFADGGPL